MARITPNERRVTRDALVVTASAIASVLTFGAVIAAEALIARERLIPTRMKSVFPHSGSYGAARPGEPIRLAVMGDSLAVGYGEIDPDSAPGIILAKEVSEETGRPVELTNVAEVGAESTGLITQLVRLHTITTPDVVLREGGRTVWLADTLGTRFRKTPELFSERDHLHPSDEGYQEAARVILPSVCAAVGVVGGADSHLPHRIYNKGSRHPLAWWAFRASRIAGARLTAAESATAVDPSPR